MQIKYRALKTAALVVTAFVVVAGCVSIGGIQRPSDSYYIVDGERIPIPLSPAARGLLISSPFDQEEIERLIDGLATFESSPLLERNNIVLLKRLSGRADPLLAEAVRLVSEEFQGSETPIFRYDDIELVLINEFRVRFQPGVTPEQARLFLNEYGAAVIDEDIPIDDPASDPIEVSESEVVSDSYFFEFDWFDERGAMEALQIVNELNERDIVISAKPDFVLLYFEDMISPPGADVALDPLDGPPAPNPGVSAVPVDIDGNPRLDVNKNPLPCVPPTVPDDQFLCEQWGLYRIEAPGVWPVSTGAGITIAIIDDGIWEHDDLPQNVALLPTFDAVPDAEGAADDRDEWSAHGTWVAGVVAARSADGNGIAGVAPDVEVLPIRIGYRTELGAALTSKQEWICDGLQHAVDSDVDIILSSMHWVPDNSEDCELATTAEEIVLVFSSGNYDEYVNFPANTAGSSSTIAVGASTVSDGLWVESNTGPEVTVVAPGQYIWTDDIPGTQGQSEGDYYIHFSATSSAAPFVAGVAALLLEEYPMAKPTHVKAWIENGAENKGLFDTSFGYGRVNANLALEEAGKYLIDISVEFPGERLDEGERKSVMAVVTLGGVAQEGVAVEFTTDNPGLLTIVGAAAPTNANGVTTIEVQSQTGSRETAYVTARVDGQSATAPVRLASIPAWGLFLCIGLALGCLTGSAFQHDQRPIDYRKVSLLVSILACFVLIDLFGFAALEWVLSPLTVATTAVTKVALEWFGFAVSQVGPVLFVPGGFAYEINYHCAGFWPIVLFSTFVMCACGPKRSGIHLLFQGISLLLLLNLARLTHLFWVGAAIPTQFDLMHDVLWPVVMILSVLTLLGLHPASRQFWPMVPRQRNY